MMSFLQTMIILAQDNGNNDWWLNIRFLFLLNLFTITSKYTKWIDYQIKDFVMAQICWGPLNIYRCFLKAHSRPLIDREKFWNFKWNKKLAWNETTCPEQENYNFKPLIW